MRTQYPTNEAQRLAALQSYGLLARPYIHEFDELVRLAALFCATPIAIISLIDHKYQYVKAAFGSQLKTIPRKYSCCAQTIIERDLVVYDRSSLAHKFGHHPLVQQGFQFYAGMPIITQQGFALGCIAVIDHQERQLSAQQLESLQLIARQLSHQFELFRQVQQLTTLPHDVFQSNLTNDPQVPSKTPLLAKMSQQLHKPIQTIMTDSQLLAEQLLEAGVAELEPTAHHIQETSAQLLALIDDMIDLAKIEHGQLAVHSEEVCLGPLIDQLNVIVGPLMVRNHNSFHVQIATRQCVFWSDNRLVRQILVNVVGNAAKFTHDGSVRIEVMEEMRNEQPFLAFHVLDTGIGMTPEQQALLFQEPLRASKSFSNHPSTGLSLAISKRLALLLGGDITFSSNPGIGSHFTVYLPLKVSAELPQSQTA
ncbi:GAF domain-containing sensor histidine kinase [Herpetosiphon sp. NSE202]|uniref:GAF domain-containing sensor histidine kinase n=1 Tax=Herpetosiphon sp. NSE202 TaxID=3351349 RepID=UPI003639BE99